VPLGFPELTKGSNNVLRMDSGMQVRCRRRNLKRSAEEWSSTTDLALPTETWLHTRSSIRLKNARSNLLGVKDPLHLADALIEIRRLS